MVDQDLNADTGHVCHSHLSRSKRGNAQGMIVPVQGPWETRYAVLL